MLFLTVGSLEEAASFAAHDQIDGIELRLDRFPSLDLRGLRQTLPLPLLFTFRKKKHGGSFSRSESERLALIEQLFQFQPDYFDLEDDTPSSFLGKMASNYPKAKLILSHHDFEKTPDLESLFAKMHSPHVYAYKIATFANSTADALRMCKFVKEKTAQGHKLSGICMGSNGLATRILGPASGNFIDYTSRNDPQKLGQVPLDDLQKIYRYKSINPSTQLFALIGDPVSKSPSHLTHNRIFSQHGINAVYLKLPVKTEELPSFFREARLLNFRGMSVTMPHKETSIAFVDQLSPEAQAIGSINTLLFQNGRLIGFNTDGVGALDAMEKKRSVKGKRCVILGAGGTARAIVFEARKRGAQVLILNRTLERAKKAGADLGCEFGSLDEMKVVKERGYDILINATSHSMHSQDSLINPEWIIPNTLVMDVAYSPKMTPLLKAAKEKECEVIFGDELFVHQAAHQFALWLK
jgi:3-dehydroquinate dehydratase/shikimate dehydrogenase